MKLFKLATTTVAVLALTAGFAQAAPVTQWNVSVDAVFNSSSIVDSNGSSPGGVTIFNSNRSLSWGTNGNSGLDIGNSPSNTVVTTNGAAVANITVTHRNQPINPPTLSRVTLDSTLTLTPNTPAGPGQVGPEVLNFKIKFLETTNDPGTGVKCADGGTNFTGVNINGCADIFVIDITSLNFPFSFDGEDYFISFFEQSNGLKSLSAAACLAATGVPGLCLGFETPESTNTTVNFAALITTERVQIPEPGSLALAGLGLAGLAGFARRRKTLQA